MKTCKLCYGRGTVIIDNQTEPCPCTRTKKENSNEYRWAKQIRKVLREERSRND